MNKNVRIWSDVHKAFWRPNACGYTSDYSAAGWYDPDEARYLTEGLEDKQLKIVPVEPIFVFGSNVLGRHGKGAALTAKQKYGAIYGQSEGLQGNSYAIVTKGDDKWYLNIRPLPLIKESVDRFLNFALTHKEYQFKVCEIGCGLAGYQPSDIAPMFLTHPGNVMLPDSFMEVLRNV